MQVKKAGFSVLECGFSASERVSRRTLLAADFVKIFLATEPTNNLRPLVIAGKINLGSPSDVAARTYASPAFAYQ